VQLAAVSEDQTRNAWAPLLEMLREGPAVDEYPGLEPLDTFINLPKGRIEFVTSAATSREGNRPVFCVLDQTEEWRPSNGGVKLAATLRRNLGKTNGSSIESPNAYLPGDGSVAEESAEYFKRIVEGRAKDDGLLYDHREAPPETDMADRESLLAGLAYTYGDSADAAGGWVDLERIAAEVWDPATHPQDARRFYLNQITHASDSWISQPEWASALDAGKTVAKSDEVVLGFDGSRKRSHSVTDATALVGCRVADGHLFLLGCWEQPDGPFGVDWQVPTVEILATVEDAFRDYKVVGMYADPALWESHVAGWEAKYGRRLKVKASMNHPIEWWMTGGRSGLIVRALEKFRSSVVDGELTHDGSSVLTRHVLNARRRTSRSGMQIMKEHPESPRKIDAALAAVLAWQCRVDAMAKGLGRKKRAKTGRVVVLR
jgi:phage terminase large subunit-like protein